MEEETQHEITVVVCPHANNSLDQVADYIALDSLFHAERVRFEILALIRTLNKSPYKYPECPELSTKKHLYRKAVYADTYKIIYKIVKDQVWVLDIFHGKRSPTQLRKLRSVKP